MSHNSELQMIRMVNRERQAHGLPQLITCVPLCHTARKHSLEQLRFGDIYHQSPHTGEPADRIRKDNIWFAVCGENVATSHSLKTSHRGLMHSPGHRANILSPDFTAVGIGIKKTVLGRLYITQLFTKSIPRVNLDTEANCLLQLINRHRAGYGLRKITFINIPFLHSYIRGLKHYEAANVNDILDRCQEILIRARWHFTSLQMGLQAYHDKRDVINQQSREFLMPNVNHIALTLKQDCDTGILVFIFILIGK